MSFTAEVKEELARVTGASRAADIAELSALTRVCGTLSFHGSGSYSVRVSTETPAAARVFVRLAHQVFGLETNITMDESVLHRSRNRFRRHYLIVLSEQPGLDRALSAMGIVSVGRGLIQGIPEELVEGRGALGAYLRGAFMGGGFVADPRGDFSLEFRVEGEPLAEGLRELLARAGVRPRINRRRQAFVVYSRSFEDIATLLSYMGATRTTMVLENVRVMRSVKNDVNRTVNAELANQRRQLAAAQDQLALVERAEEDPGLDALPPAVAEFCRLRRAHPDLSFAELGALVDPPLSKSAIHHRYLRLKELVGGA